LAQAGRVRRSADRRETLLDEFERSGLLPLKIKNVNRAVLRNGEQFNGQTIVCGIAFACWVKMSTWHLRLRDSLKFRQFQRRLNDDGTDAGD
jgi:hypothetical protein